MHFRFKDIQIVHKRWLTIYHTISKQKRVGMTILTPDFTHIIDFVTESISRDEDHILFDSTYMKCPE